MTTVTDSHIVVNHKMLASPMVTPRLITARSLIIVPSPIMAEGLIIAL